MQFETHFKYPYGLELRTLPGFRSPMPSGPRHAGAQPRVLVELASRRGGSVPNQWVMAWRVRNVGEGTVQLLAVWVPHGQFRSPRRALPRPADLPPGGSAEIELPVMCQEVLGSVVENAFLILSARWRGEPWRILARLRIEFDRAGAPESKTELVTAQPVGFSRGGPRRSS